MRENLSNIVFGSYILSGSYSKPKSKPKIAENLNVVKKAAKTLSKKEILFDKFGGCCAYCGANLLKVVWDIDHIKPKYLGGSNDIENLNPSCRRCNVWKKTFSIEEFRQEIMAQSERLLKSSAGVRLAVDYGVIEIKTTKIKPLFYFEQLKQLKAYD
jgi:hypothetical protein